MEFLDRQEEIKRLRNALNRDSGPSFVVVYGRRRLGKSTLIKRVLTADDIYYMAGDFMDRVQLNLFRNQAATKFPELANIDFSSWEDLLMMINRLTTKRFAICLDEFPYMVRQTPSLPSSLQRLIDTKSLKFDLIICGSSQRMMQNMVLSSSEPLYGRANAIINVQPIPIPFLQKALDLDATATVEEYSVWGGVPRYWELREEYHDLHEAIIETMFNQTGVLYDEPKNLFFDDMNSVVQAESLMSIVAGGASRLSEIASRVGRDATALSAPIDRLIKMHYLRREIPFGEDSKKAKKSLYQINDPLMDFYYSFVIPNLSNIGRNRINFIDNYIASNFTGYVAKWWEHLCREAVSGNTLFGHLWKEASRWWGSIPTQQRQPDGKKYIEMEFDVITESTDRKALLVGECKWTNPEVAGELLRRLNEKISMLPLAAGKTVYPVLFLKNKPKDEPTGCRILYPQDVINLTYGDSGKDYISEK